MGCYFSKEISDLMLLYSEYQYNLVSVGNGGDVIEKVRGLWYNDFCF